MKKYTIIFLLLFISCNYIFPEQQKSANSRLGPYLWIVLTTCYVGTPKVKSVSYIDNMDGSVTANMLYDMDRPNCVVLPKTEVRSVLIKKCMQGQVYLKDQNNCRGKGSEADGWGAEKYQYCPTNDYSCERRTTLLNYADEIKSPAAVSCDQNIDLGRKWKLPEQSNFRGDSSSFFNIIQEIPKVITNTVIVPMVSPSTKESIEGVGFDPVAKVISIGWELPKNNSFYIFCISN